MHDASDQELAIEAARGGSAAFAAIVERHYDRIYRLAWRFLGSRVGAEDVAQEVCLKLAHAIRSYRGESELGTWIFRIAYNAARDHARAGQRFRLLPPSEIMSLVEGADERAAPDAIEGQELWAAVRRLPDKQRDATLLVYGEDLSHAEAATVLGCTEKTVSWHLHEARKRLKAMLETAG